MLFTIEGTYTEGKVELPEQLTGIKYAKVLMTFLTAEEEPSLPHSLHYGQFASESFSPEDDFRIAESRGEVSEGEM